MPPSESSSAPEKSDELSRGLSLFDITMIGVGAMVGAVLFIGFMFAFAFVSNAGIERQHRRIEALHRRHRTSGESEAQSV